MSNASTDAFWLFGIVAAIALFLSCLMPSLAFAETEDIYAEADEAQRKVEQSAKDYDEAVQRVDSINASIEANKQKKADLMAQFPVVREKGAQAVKEMYMMRRVSSSFIMLVFDSGSFSEFQNSVSYLQHIEDKHSEDILDLKRIQAELEAISDDLEAQRAESVEEQQRAEDTLKEAQRLREEAQRKAQEAAEAEERARKAAEAQAAAARDAEAAASVGESQSTPLPSPPANTVDWSQDKAAFVDSWGARIDAYLSGSPLSGKGRVFAEAAWDYGVDPRWSPAISTVESSKGSVCFKPHNAWGWGSVSWPDWETAIRSHVSGLAKGYGYTLSEAAARKYCPPNWQFWYSRCAAEMNSI